MSGAPAERESLRERLSRLARLPRSLPHGASLPRRILAPRLLEDFLPGEEIVGSRGSCWLGRWPLDDRSLGAGSIAPAVARGLAMAAEALAIAGAATARDDRTHPPVAAPRDDHAGPPSEDGRAAQALPATSAREGGLLLLDLETTGFAGTPLFLAGFMEVRGADSGPSARPNTASPPGSRPVSIEQLFARDYTEEAALLEAIASRLERAALLVTFNGKTFDMPFLRDRAACHHVTLPESPTHLDLLHPARRMYRGILPNCRLQTLEAHLGSATRVGDVSGWEIPSRYHDAVRRKDPSGLLGVFLHNARDLITLARLFLEVGRPSDPPSAREGVSAP